MLVVATEREAKIREIQTNKEIRELAHFLPRSNTEVYIPCPPAAVCDILPKNQSGI